MKSLKCYFDDVYRFLWTDFYRGKYTKVVTLRTADCWIVSILFHGLYSGLVSLFLYELQFRAPPKVQISLFLWVLTCQSDRVTDVEVISDTTTILLFYWLVQNLVIEKVFFIDINCYLTKGDQGCCYRHLFDSLIICCSNFSWKPGTMLYYYLLTVNNGDFN